MVVNISDIQIGLLKKLYTVFIITDRDGVVQLSHSIFDHLNAKIRVGDRINDHLLTSHTNLIINTEDILSLNGNIYIDSGIKGLSIKMFVLEMPPSQLLWVSALSPMGNIDIKQIPHALKQFYQYDTLIEKMLSLNSIRLSLQDADELYVKMKAQNKGILKVSAQYKRVVESVNDVIFETDANGLWTFLNSSWEKKMGYTVSESVGLPFYDFLHPDDVKKNEVLFLPLIMREKTYCAHEIRYITNGGVVKWMRVYAILLLDDQDQLIGTSGSLTDITEEVESKEKYRLLADNINDIICLHNLDGTFAYISPSFTSLLGYDPAEISSLNPYKLVHPDDIGKIATIRELLLTEGGNSMMTFRIRSKSGVYKWFETNNKLIKDSNGRLQHIITSSRIIDERIRAEENTMKTLEERSLFNDQKARFISMASHEFRTPMTSIQMSTDIISHHLQRMEGPQLPDLHRHTEIISGEIDRFELIMNRILLLGKTDNGSVVLRRTDEDLTDIIRRCIARVREIKNDGRSIICTTHGRTRMISADKTYLEHIIENLLTNALKFSKGKPAPLLNITYHEDRFELCMKDFGIGIPLSEQPYLFTSFYRASNAEFIKGTGLGLVIIKNLVRLHGGNITITSEENIGTKVEVMIRG